MSSDYSLDSQEAIRLYAQVVMARAEELSLTGALNILPNEQQELIRTEAKELYPSLENSLLCELEDKFPELSGLVLTEIRRRRRED